MLLMVKGRGRLGGRVVRLLARRVVRLSRRGAKEGR